MSSRLTALLLFLVVPLLFLASCQMDNSKALYKPTDRSEETSSDLVPPNTRDGYELIEDEQPAMDSAAVEAGSSSPAKPLDRPKAAPPGNSDHSSDTTTSNPSVPIEPVPVLPPVPPTPPDPSEPPIEIDDPVIIYDSVCYEWGEGPRNMLYIALRVQNTGVDSVEIIDFELALTTDHDVMTLSYLEDLKDKMLIKSYITKHIKPGQFGYIVAYYPFEPMETETGTIVKSVSVKLDHCPATTIRKELEIDEEFTYRWVGGAEKQLQVGTTVYNTYTYDVYVFFLEIILLDDQDRFIGVFCYPSNGGIEAGDEFYRTNLGTGIYSSFIAGNLARIQGVSYFLD